MIELNLKLTGIMNDYLVKTGNDGHWLYQDKRSSIEEEKKCLEGSFRMLEKL